MFRVSFLLFSALLLVSSLPSQGVSASSAFSSPSHLNDRLLSVRFQTLTAPNPTSICSPTYGCLPDGFPVPDPSTVQYIKFPNGVSINLQGFGTASLPFGYPVQDLPSYDSSTNTVTDPVLAAILAWSLSTEANPTFNANDWSGWSLPSLSGTSLTGLGGIGSSNNNNNNNGNVGEGEASTGESSSVNGNGSGNGNLGGLTGVVISGNGSGNGGSGTGSTINTNPNGGTTTTNPNGGTTTTNPNGGTTATNTNGGTTSNPTGTSSIGGSTTTNNGGGGTSKNGASALTGSITLVAGLAAATLFAAFL